MSKSFEEQFIKSKGNPFIFEYREVRLSYKLKLVDPPISFIIKDVKTKSEWVQGIVVSVPNGIVNINGFKGPRMVLWEDIIPKIIHFTVEEGDELIIYNVWKVRPDGAMMYGHNGAGLCVHIKGDYSWFIECNDGFPDAKFEDLSFNLLKNN